MTKKDFIAFASMLKAELNSTCEGTSGEAAVISMANKMSDYFSQMNPRFKFATFFNACGLNSSGTDRLEM